ncbi:rhodanese-related sulfurtransferase [Pseudalkalibacillus caeni]|uniref:tRNA uridine(34) hydroxylase n=1 Tax=Exobacillus caeni TaxID=2574798 RepID=A0A5R9F562_9BACL|nr:rhodanese-related sulfurtransferase [Pseudalkalibacillus caeni]TLS37540.1 rhodanese-related sulfurtransferase [Pseudalkalibacillus caeni]
MGSKAKQYRVLLYYKYVPIEDPEYFAKKHLKFCKELGLRGRILVAKEGINGTVSGTVEQTDEYMEKMHEDPRFEDLWFKIDEAEGHAFKKMHVRPRSEIVTLKLDNDINPNQKTGKYLEPEDFYQALQDEDTIVIDARNDYEYDIGHFRNAIRPDVKAFRDLPEWIETNLGDKKDKKVLTYCTGGIRCEKFSGYLLDQGFEDVSQLHGGIVSYGKDPDVKGKLWDGKCFVFDDRLAVDINHTEDARVVGKCYHCGTPAEQYINCANVECDLLHIVCENCEKELQHCCSETCLEKKEKHEKAEVK